ncbi:MAG TPA: ABC transporter substrate-binding protein, partial [Acidimicrobiales bacterium]|nr:ABC transporter substrate-binding protein [Acidimicrobiales bacterium]
TVVVYVAPEQDAVLDFITAAIANDDTNEQVEATYEGYVELLNATYQTYGRQVELVFLDGSGQSQDEVAARADAVRAVEELGAFAVLGSPALNDAWSQELAARGVPCIGCFGLPEPDPNIFTTLPSNDQNRLILTEYLLTKLAGEPAVHAGDEALQATTRSFGHLYIETSQSSVDNAAELQADLEAGGSGFTEQRPYTLDPARLQEQATPIISGFKAAGITTVVVQGDPIAMATFTREATAQDYFPEWVIGPSTLIDTAAFGRTYDQLQWANAFGLSPLAARVDPDAEETLYEWYFGEEAPADDSEGVIAPNPLILFNALQEAGPNLTVDTFRQGMYLGEPIEGAISAVSFTFGDHGLFPGIDGPDQAGIDDWTEIWWDAEATGPDELEREGTGLYRYVDGGRRFFVGGVTEELRVFEEEGSVTIYDEVPPTDAERIGTYDPPGG